MFERVKEILSYYVEGYEIKPESDFMADLKMLSLEIVDFIIDLEKEYNIRIPEKKLAKVKTVQQMIDLVESLKK
ncbi:MAG: acyl carrier protein [Firmicutes bacterium]|jgi:acyl carrier protein|nr:acyl carrier protein [Bacillota bacterium]